MSSDALIRDHFKIGTFGSSRKFVRTRVDLLKAPAYICLSPSARLILRDFIAYYEQQTHFDTDLDTFRLPLKYTFAMCREPICRSTFYRSLAALAQKQFIKPHHQTRQLNGAATYWVALVHWQIWKPDQDGLAILSNFARRRATAHEDRTQLTFDFLSHLDHLDAEEVFEATNCKPLARAIKNQSDITHNPARRRSTS